MESSVRENGRVVNCKFPIPPFPQPLGLCGFRQRSDGSLKAFSVRAIILAYNRLGNIEIVGNQGTLKIFECFTICYSFVI